METKISRFNPNDLKLLEINARYMEKEEYNQLVENIKKDGKLTTVPFCYKNKNGFRQDFMSVATKEMPKKKRK